MPLLNEQDLRQRTITKGLNKRSHYFSEGQRYELSTAGAIAPKVHDIFLSHSYMDQDLIKGIVDYLEGFGFSVYVDWIEDKQLDRTCVTAETAKTLRAKMGLSKSLLYAFTENATTSCWMPWELGYFDGKNGRAAVLPIKKTPSSADTYKGTEFVGIYPVVKPAMTISYGNVLHVFNGDKKCTLNEWINLKKDPS